MGRGKGLQGRYKTNDGYAYAAYPRYTVDDFIRKGRELAGDMTLTEEQKRIYALE